jgi:hypothetical protein
MKRERFTLHNRRSPHSAREQSLARALTLNIPKTEGPVATRDIVRDSEAPTSGLDPPCSDASLRFNGSTAGSDHRAPIAIQHMEDVVADLEEGHRSIQPYTRPPDVPSFRWRYATTHAAPALVVTS